MKIQVMKRFLAKSMKVYGTIIKPQNKEVES